MSPSLRSQLRKIWMAVGQCQRPEDKSSAAKDWPQRASKSLQIRRITKEKQ